MTAHALYSPSDSHLWTKCYGYIEFKKKGVLPNFSNVYSEEGRRIHRLIEDYLFYEFDISENGSYDGIIHWDSGIHGNDYTNEEIKDIEKYGIPISDVIKSLTYYVEDNVSHVKKDVKVYVEKTFGDGDFFGTPDIVVVTKEYNEKYLRDVYTINVIDLKTGLVPVKAYKNTQLMCYATLILNDLAYEYKLLYRGDMYFTQFNLVIVQPNSRNKIDSWKYNVNSKESREFNNSLYIVNKRIGYPERKIEFKSGDHCKYCKAKILCPKFNSQKEEFINETARITN
jgi:hypothetical protein